MRQISIYLFIIIAALSVGRGQQSPPVIPPGPLVQLRAPDPGQWTIVNSITNPTSNAGSSDGSATITTSTYQFTKTKNILHATYTDSQQRIWQIWNVGKIHAFIWADGKSVGFGVPPLPGTADALFIDTTQCDFPDFTWITKANFIDIETIDGKQCLIFQAMLNFGGEQVLSKAMVDLETRLPVRFEGATGVSNYTFSENPPNSQTVPAAVQSAITSQARKEQILARIPGPAY